MFCFPGVERRSLGRFLLLAKEQGSCGEDGDEDGKLFSVHLVDNISNDTFYLDKGTWLINKIINILSFFF
jgi:hypothetical protein